MSAHMGGIPGRGTFCTGSILASSAGSSERPFSGLGFLLTLVGSFLCEVLAAAPLGVPEPGAEAETYEPLQEGVVSELHSDVAVAGRHYQVLPQVRQDGRWNHYEVTSDFGALHPVGESALRLRLAEFADLEVLEDLDRGEAVGKGMKRSVVAILKTPYEVVKRVIFNPIYALEAIPSDFLHYAGVISDVRQIARDGFRAYAKDAIGYDSAVKGLARAVEVDHRSLSPQVQAELHHDAWGFWAGYMPLYTAGRHYMPDLDVATQVGHAGHGNVGSAVRDLDRMIRPRSERRQLKRMGVDEAERKAFTGHPQLAGGRHAVLTRTAYQMKGARNRDEVIARAVVVTAEHEALALCEQTMLLARYHHAHQPLAGLIAAGGHVAGVGVDGTVVIPWAYDHVMWTESVAQEVHDMIAQLRYLPGKHAIEIWCLGSVSERAKARITTLGIRVVTVDRAEWTAPILIRGPIARLKARYEADVEEPAASALRVRPDHEPRPWTLP